MKSVILSGASGADSAKRAVEEPRFGEELLASCPGAEVLRLRARCASAPLRMTPCN